MMTLHIAPDHELFQSWNVILGLHLSYFFWFILLGSDAGTLWEVVLTKWNLVLYL